MMVKSKILAVDDDPNFLQSLANFLELKNYQVQTVANPYQAIESFKKQEFDCVLLDLKMPGMSGFKIMQKILTMHPDFPIILISGQGTIPTAIRAIKEGAYDFVEKPIDGERLLITIKNALEKRNLQKERSTLLAQIGEAYSLVGVSKALRQVIDKIEVVASNDAKVLITGESGTGKELVARAIHNQSRRSSGPFVKVNCAAIPNALLESELFGYKKGAFTGASQNHKGKFLVADGGTLFLDEIGDMTLPLQAKLLRVLQDNEVEVIGEEKPIKIDVRVITATNKNLHRLIREGKFREDLFYRLNVIQISIPPLRERAEDIPVLARYFLKQYAQIYNKQIIDFKPDALTILSRHSWPGNVRELRNVVEKLAILTKNQKITAEEAREAIGEKTNEKPIYLNFRGSLQEARELFEKQYILETLQRNNWKIIKSAEALGLNRSALFKKMKKLGIVKKK